MSSAPAKASRAPDPRKSLKNQIIVGKDILELLSTAMYVDPLAVIREYVQNAADSIDCAYGQGILQPNERGRVEVELDPNGRTLVLRDNGAGIPQSDVERALVSFGASAKRGKGLRGFRGVGRLGGLAYARELIFRTRSPTDSLVTELHWDCKELRERLAESDGRPDLEDVVRRVVHVTRREPRARENHFFEVRLEGVVRLWNDRLVNSEEVRKYLAQVCPLPFHPSFRFGNEIGAFLSNYMMARHLDIRMNDSEPLTRPHVAEFAVSATKRDRFTEWQPIELPGLSDGPAAVGWILHHSYLGALKGSPEIRGLRARSGDIQVGDGELFTKSFPETRFNSWVVGEIHVLDPRLRPNGRRDSFEQNFAFATLLNELLPTCRDLAQRCRSSSAIRSRVRAFEESEKQANQWLRALSVRVPGGKSRSSLLKALDDVLERMIQLSAIPTLKQQVAEDFQRRVKRLAARKKRILALPAKSLAVLSPRKRRLYREVAGLIKACAPSKQLASTLLDKIADRLARQRN